MKHSLWKALAGDRYWHGAMQMLADFAKFSGVGAQTANGMGQVRRIVGPDIKTSRRPQ